MKKMYLTYLVFFITLTSCSFFARDAESQFADIFQDCRMNMDLRLQANETPYKATDGVDLIIASVSTTSVIFPAGFNIRILNFENNSWKDEQNDTQYLPLDSKYIIGKNDPLLEFKATVIPISPLVSEKTTLRVVIHGNIYENKLETKQCSGAYIDIVVEP